MRLADARQLVNFPKLTFYRPLQIPGRNDTLKDNATTKKGPGMPKQAVRKALKGLRNAAQNTTT
jgi:hypothetical protein